MNKSVYYRLKGNEIYQQLNSNLAPVIFKSRFTEAEKLYNLAFAEAHDRLDQSSACKNLLKIILRFQEFYSNREKTSEYYFYSRMAQKHASDALSYGKDVQNYEWIANIKSEATNSFDYYNDGLINDSYKKRIDNLLKLKESSIKEVCALINYNICLSYFRIANELINSNLVKNALATNHECDFFYEESLKFFEKNDGMILKLDELKEDYILQRFTLEGLQSKTIAQNLLNECINNNEYLNTDQIWDIIDWYRDSITKLKGKDVECEAELLSDIGYIYDEILKIKDKAKTNYRCCWHLIDSLRPKVLTHFKWYKRCANALEKYQKEKLAEEEQSFTNQRARVYNKIKKDIEKLREIAKKGSFEFLPFIYKEYPPKIQNYSFKSDLNSKNLKKSIQTAIYHYHPDKNPKNEFGNEWYFTTDEITKILTNFYERMKNVED